MRSMKELRAACLPFATRAFRGPRLRRMLAFSVVLGVLSVLIGAWLALGSGEIERETRRALSVEQHEWNRRLTEFTVYADDIHEYRYLSEERARINRLVQQGVFNEEEIYGEVVAVRTNGLERLRAAAGTVAPPEHAQLQRRAADLYATHAEYGQEDPWRPGFDWNDERHVASLKNIVAQDLLPDVEYYSSPVGAMGAVSIVGFFAGGVFVVLMMFAAPLLGGVQVAQEVHENTLQPVTGTSLSTRQLVLGLAAGPLAQAGVLAVPQLAIVLVAAATAGRVLPALGFIGTAMAAGVLLLAVAMLAGLLVGRRRAPGLVGIGLCSLLGISVITGLALTEAYSDDSIGLVMLVPHAGPLHLLREAFAPAHHHLSAAVATGLDLRLGASVVAFVLLAGLTALAMERRMVGKVRASLTRLEALAGAAILIVVAALTVPNDTGDEWPMLLAGMALLVVPFELLLMARVPTGDAPPTMRRAPLGKLLLEVGAAWAVYLVVFLTLVGGPGELGTPSPAGIFCILWALGVTALVGIRAASIPARIPAMVWLGLCLAAAFFNFVLGAVIIEDTYRSSASGDVPMLVLGTLSWILGAVQLILTVVIPVVLVRSIRSANSS